MKATRSRRGREWAGREVGRGSMQLIKFEGKEDDKSEDARLEKMRIAGAARTARQVSGAQ